MKERKKRERKKRREEGKKESGETALVWIRVVRVIRG
jgi:hypothetical protein